MAIYVNGKKISSIFVEGKSILFGYSNGKLVFSKKSGWQVGSPCTLTVSASYNNSIAGTITLNRYDYYENGVITDNYYEVASTSLSRATEGVVVLSLGEGTSILFGNASHSAEYYAPANGTFNLSASELSSMYRIKKQSGVLNLGTSKTVTSYYLEPIWNMSIVGSGSANITLNAGWAIAHNRTSRLALSSSNVYSAGSLSTPGDGTWPVYAYSNSGTEMSVAGLTCAVNAHQVYDSKNIRHVGWVTMSGGSISSVSSLASNTGADVSKTISGTTLSVAKGYATDTDGIRVEVPAFTYNFSDMIPPAQDSTEEVEAAHGKQTQDITYGMTALLNPQESCSISGPTTIRLYGSLSGRTGGTGAISSLRYMLSGESSWRQKNFTGNNKTAKWNDISIASGQNVTQVMMTGSWSLSTSASNWSATGHIYAYQNVTTQGTPQSRPIYAKITRNQNNNQKTVTTQTSTGDSSPFVSYVFIGTINVPRNGSTGTIS